MGYPAMAVSYDSFKPEELTDQGDYCAELLKKIPWGSLGEKTVVNLNFPAVPVKDAEELKICRHTRVSWQDWYEAREDPRGHKYYWLNGVMPKEKISPGTDRDLLTKGHITMTPLHFDFTDREAIETLEAKLRYIVHNFLKSIWTFCFLIGYKECIWNQFAATATE